MNDKLKMLFAKIRQFEHAIIAQIQEREQKFGYEVQGSKVRFSQALGALHRKIAESLAHYL
jgi:hypothetical protein